MALLCQSCNKSNEGLQAINDFEVRTYDNYYFKNDVFKNFVEEYINLPENTKRQVFTLYIDQRMDTLLFTIWRNPRKTVDLENSFGYFYCNGKAIIIYSPFFKFFGIRRDTLDEKAVSKLYDKELEYYKTNKQELVMWQLQIPYHSNSYFIQKSFNRIFNTTKAPIPDSVKVEINYQAN
jgi:hypothetical protein